MVQPVKRAVLSLWKAIKLVVRAVWAIVRVGIFSVTAVAVAPIAAFAVAMGAFVLLPLPGDIPVASPPDLSRPSVVFDANGNQIGELRGFDTRLPMERSDVPDVLKKAVVAAEDRRFYEHEGFDPEGTLRALWVDVQNKQVVEGGSTITQQYVKQVFLNDDRTLTRKIREAILASRIDRELDKDDILFRYLQVSYFGDGAYGAAAAAESYFRKPLTDLTLSEAATLAGVIPAPSKYNPRDSLPTAEERRRLVLDLMRQQALITDQEHDDALAQELWTPTGEEAPENVTVIWPRATFDSPYPYFMDYVERWLISEYGEDRILTGGLRVYTTLDPDMQAAAEQEVAAELSTAPDGLAMSLVSVEPQTGFVKALVGGADYSAPGGQVNLALGRQGGGSGRQPGSAFKPFVLAEAFEQRIPPTHVVNGGPHAADNTEFENYGGAVYGDLTLEESIIRSANTPFTRLTEQVGVEAVLQRARSLGADPLAYDPARDGLAVALGSSEVSPLGMASAYATFAAGGTHAEAQPVAFVTDAEGVVVDDFSDGTHPQVIEPNTAANINGLLGRVIEEGTAKGRSIGRPAAGKTGTTTANKDAWFVGYTPALSTSVWVGYRDTPSPLVNINGVGAVTGGTIPAGVWQRYMLRALADVPPTGFSDPTPILPRVEVVDVAEPEPDVFRPGERDTILQTDRGSYIGERLPPPPPPPMPDPLPTTTTTVPATTTTTTTVASSTTTTVPASTTTSTTLPQGEP